MKSADAVSAAEQRMVCAVRRDFVMVLLVEGHLRFALSENPSLSADPSFGFWCEVKGFVLCVHSLSDDSKSYELLIPIIDPGCMSRYWDMLAIFCWQGWA